MHMLFLLAERESVIKPNIKRKLAKPIYSVDETGNLATANKEVLRLLTESDVATEISAF